MIRKILEHPYHVTSAVFIAIIAVGIFFLNWHEENLIYFLLVYFVVILGIRLDDITIQIGSLKTSRSESADSVIGQLREIQLSMKTIEKELSGIGRLIQNQIASPSEVQNETKEE